VASGQAIYTANCTGCHGTSKASDTKVNTASKITTVMNSVSSHVNAGLNTRFSDQNKLDLAAYIASPK
jgi:mono/diheme cytochrome c family protein